MPPPVRLGGPSEATHSSRDLGVSQVPEVLPALRAGCHPPILRLHPHLGDKVELGISFQGLHLHIVVIICREAKEEEP